MAEEKKTTLKEAAEEYAYQGIPEEMKSELKPIGDEVIKNFKAGAEWQAEQLLKGSPMPEDTVLFNKGIAEGRRLERQDMLKDAVEGRAEEVTFNNGEKHNTVYYSLNEGTLTSESRIWIPYMGFKDGDKVKIIIVKEKENKE